MRNIIKVIQRIIDYIPDDFKDKEELTKELNNRGESASYTAPEAMFLRWQEVSYILGTYLGEIDTPWKQKIADIFGDKELK